MPNHKELSAAPVGSSSFRAALSLLFSVPDAGPCRPGAETRTLWWMPLIGLAIGVAYACLYRVAWRCFGEVQGIRLMPAVCVWLVDVSFCGGVMLLATARLTDRLTGSAGGGTVPFGAVGLVAFVVLTILKLTLWIAIPEGVSTWPGIWSSALNIAYPHAFYRPLLLAPLWGRWGMVLSSGLGRPSDDADPLVRQLATRGWSQVVLGSFVVIAGLTAVYCGYSGRWPYGCVVALGVMGLTFLFGVLASRRVGGQSRETIRACGLVAEFSFLILYMGLSIRIYSG